MKHQVAETETWSPDIGELRAFCTVVDLGSITAAARALGESKGNISRRITRLERGLGVALVRRSPRLVQATEDGLAYRMRVGRVLELLDDAGAAVQHARGTPSGHLRVTAPIDLGLSIVAPLVAGFVERFPKLSIEMLLTETFLDFDAHQIDVALRAASGLRDSSLVAHKLKRLEISLVAAPAYLKQHRPVRTPDDLLEHRLLLTRAARGHATLSLIAKDSGEHVRLRVRSAISASDFSFSREAALARAGIAVVPTVTVERDLEKKRLAPVLVGYAVESSASLFLVHPGTRLIPPKIAAFRDYMLEAFGVRGHLEPAG
jgi:DNA-binding transcriptional LysR family regulator